MRDRKLSHALFFFGIVVIWAGIAFTPAFFIKHLRPAGIHATATFIKVYIALCGCLTITIPIRGK